MSAVLETTISKPGKAFPGQNGFPQTVRWTQREYYRMADLGFFVGKRVELVRGEILDMSPLAKPKSKIKVADILP